MEPRHALPDPTDVTAPDAGAHTDADGPRGRNAYSTKAVTKIIAAAIRTVPGTASLDSTFGRSYPRIDVQIDDEYDTLSCDLIIAATWPSPVTSVAETVRSTVDAWVRGMTGIRPVRINVTVGPVEPGPAVSEEQLAAFDVTPHPVPVHVNPLVVTPVEVDTPAELAPVRTQAPLRLAPVTTTRTTSVKSVSPSPAFEPRGIDAGLRPRISSPVVAPPLPIARVAISPNRFHDRPVTVAPTLPLQPVSVFPLASHARSVRVAPPLPLQRIVSSTPTVMSVRPPAPITPTPVRVYPSADLVTPRVMPASPLLPIAVKRSSVKPVSVQRRNLTPVVVETRPLTPVTVARRGVREITIAAPVPTAPVTVTPRLTTLRSPQVRQRTIMVPTAPRVRAAQIIEESQS